MFENLSRKFRLESKFLLSLSLRFLSMIKRELEQIINNKLYLGKAIIILGPRQVGKTTLLRKIVDRIQNNVLWLNGDEPGVRSMMSNIGSMRLKQIIGNNDTVIIDEAQRIENIGITIKLITDNFPEIQVLASGSSAFELANKINEPLTGRKWEYLLYPVSFAEISNYTDLFTEMQNLENRLIFGYYPEVVTSSGNEKDILKQLSDSYLYKDLLIWENIKKPSKIESLLKALAFQVGHQVSYNELSQIVGLDKETIEKYIDLLEKVFVIFRLGALSRNLRNELKRTRKIYFYDNGIRNALIANFNPLSLRQDTGQLWENFLISERVKFTNYQGMWMNRYFWRTHTQQEIDYVEEYDGKLYAYEFKWGKGKKYSFPKSFVQAYPEHETKVITPDNYIEFITINK